MHTDARTLKVIHNNKVGAVVALFGIPVFGLLGVLLHATDALPSDKAWVAWLVAGLGSLCAVSLCTLFVWNARRLAREGLDAPETPIQPWERPAQIVFSVVVIAVAVWAYLALSEARDTEDAFDRAGGTLQQPYTGR